MPHSSWMLLNIIAIQPSYICHMVEHEHRNNTNHCNKTECAERNVFVGFCSVLLTPCVMVNICVKMIIFTMVKSVLLFYYYIWPVYFYWCLVLCKQLLCITFFFFFLLITHFYYSLLIRICVQVSWYLGHVIIEKNK